MNDAPVRTEGADRPSRWLVTCDHASNRVPREFANGALGLSQSDMSRHIAWDPGALGVARAIAERLDAPCVWATYSRLVIDPNRGEDDPTLVMSLCDGTVIPGNHGIDDEEVERRIAAYHRPYHDRVKDLASRRADTVYVSIHTFTRQFRNRPPRPWDIGLLFAADRRLADPLGDILAERGVRVGMNEPYAGDLEGDAVDRHASAAGLPNILIEVRNDLARTPAEQADWGRRLANALEEAAERADL